MRSGRQKKGTPEPTKHMPAVFSPETAVALPPSSGGQTESPNARGSTGASFISRGKQRKMERSRTMANKEILREKHSAIRAHVEVVRKQLRLRDKGKAHVLKPGENRWLAYWDMISAIALLYTATLTPFEVAFLQPAEGAAAAWSEPWFLINRALDVIFSFDITLQFFLAYHASDPDTGADYLVEQHSQIVWHYLTSWFPIDSFTVIVPSSFDIYLAHTSGPDAPAPVGGSDTGGKLAANASILRVLRILRLFKLVRLARASRIIKRWRAKITLSNGTLTLLQCVFELTIATHWYACFFSLQAAMAGNVEDTWLGSSMLGYCETADVAQAQNPTGAKSTEGLTALEGCPGLSIGSWYLAAASWSIMIITGTGGTGHWPSSRNDTETIIVTFLVVMGAFLWTTVLARFCEVATNSNPGQTHFLQSLDEINQYSRINLLPNNLSNRLREYMHEQRAVQQKMWAEKALPQLSIKLQVECLLHCHKYWLDAIWFVRDFDKLCKVKLAQNMSPRVLTPGEVAPRRHMYVIGGRGLVMYGMKVLHRGSVWGDDVILEEERHFSPYMARAMSYVEVSAMHRNKLLEIVEAFPTSYKLMRRANIYLALRRHVLAMAEASAEKKLKDQKKNGEAEAASSDFVSTVHKAAQELGETDDMAEAQAVSQPDSGKTLLQLEAEVMQLKLLLKDQGEQRKEAEKEMQTTLNTIVQSLGVGTSGSKAGGWNLSFGGGALAA